jgi:Short C-terminal domain
VVPGEGAGSGDDDDRIAELERLAKLKDSGALTEEEFDREKARILGC